MNANQLTRLVAVLVTCFAARASSEGIDPWEMNARLGRGINLGNALEAPEEGQWGVTLREEYFQLIADAGFDAVRIPVKWSGHSLATPPYTIDPDFFDRVDWAIQNALSRNLAVVMNIHHFDELIDNPNRYQQDKFVSLWNQIAEHYKDYPDELLFELLNEPHDPLTNETWHSLIRLALGTIRPTNPHRNIVIGATGWNGKSELVNKLQLPADDRHIIATFHHYSPFQFTHQGAEWVDGSDAWLGTTWQGTTGQVRDITDDFDDIHAWSITNDRPVYMGEFGAYSKADMESRIRWTRTSAREAEARRFSWAYWEFCAGFGAYDDDIGRWNQLHTALVPDAPAQNQVRNGQFDSAMDHWRLTLRGGCSATATTVETTQMSGANALKVYVHNCPAGACEAVLLTQSDFQLERGKLYRISFAAKADGPRTIKARLHRRGNERFVYWQQQQSLTTSPRTFDYLFDSGVTDSDVQLDFLLGCDLAPVYIDNVSLREAWDCRQMIDTGRRLRADLIGAALVPDCYVDAYDLSQIARRWSGNDPLADISGLDGAADGVVDFHDLMLCAEQWLTCNNPQDLRCD